LSVVLARIFGRNFSDSLLGPMGAAVASQFPMQPLPHHYRVTGTGSITGDVELTAERLTALRSASPAEFGGPGDRWSPETLLVGAVADCFILTFRGIANASKLSWTSLDCNVTGTLDRVDRVTLFTHLDIGAHLVIPAGVDADLARRLLEKAEHNCLISSSLKASITLNATVEIAAPGELRVSA
jgi:organic hydroperoxide reductase OsmC/OhrA